MKNRARSDVRTPSRPKEIQAIRIATVIVGVMNALQPGGDLAHLASHEQRSAEDAIALRDYQRAMDELNRSEDEAALPHLWYAAYEHAQHLMYIRTRNALAKRLAEVVAAKNRRKWS